MSKREVQPIYARVSDSKVVFGVSRATMYRWISAGFVTLHKRGGCSFLKVKDVLHYIETGEPIAA